MSETFLIVIWYLVIGFCIVAYTVLDGFDLGVGILHCFTKKDLERRVFLNAIGPVWDGNEVWLVIVIGALFAGFPTVYATLLSGFYDFCFLFIAALIFRAVAIEFRSKKPSKKWRYFWDAVFSVSSLAISLGVGIILGNLVMGIPLNDTKDFVGSFSLFLRPYPLLIGITSVALFTMHGAIYLVMKTEGELHDRLRDWANRCIIFFAIMYFLATTATLIYVPIMADRFRDMPALFLIAIVALLSFANIPREFSKGNDGRAFASSCSGIALLLVLFGLGTYPMLVRSTINPEANSLTIFNSSSSPLTLTILFIIVLIGVPLVLAYGTCIYRIFRGKVKIGSMSY